ncbi:hypothetical protein HPB47_021173, partial [Ixodes persulcatus]
MQRLSVYVDSKLLRRPGREKLLHSVKNAKRTTRMMMHRDHGNPEQNEWVKKANFLVDFLVSEYSNETNAPTVELLWMPVAWNDEQTFLGARAKQMHLPHLALVRQNCEHLETGFPGDFFGDRDSMVASYVEARDVDVVISKTEDEGFTDILVLYDEKFALYGMGLLMRRVQRSNVTFSYLRLSPDRKLVKRGIETVFRSQAERNSLYSGFGVLVFSNYTLAEQLEADLVIENSMDPNIILVVFYNGWDLGLNSWYYTRVTSYPYEKLIHVILRSFPRNVRNRMKRASQALDGKYHV